MILKDRFYNCWPTHKDARPGSELKSNLGLAASQARIEFEKLFDAADPAFICLGQSLARSPPQNPA